MVVRNRRWSWWCGSYGEEDMCEKVLEVRSMYDRVLAVVFVF